MRTQKEIDRDSRSSYSDPTDSGKPKLLSVSISDTEGGTMPGDSTWFDLKFFIPEGSELDQFGYQTSFSLKIENKHLEDGERVILNKTPYLIYKSAQREASMEKGRYGLLSFGPFAMGDFGFPLFMERRYVFWREIKLELYMGKDTQKVEDCLISHFILSGHISHFIHEKDIWIYKSSQHADIPPKEWGSLGYFLKTKEYMDTDVTWKPYP